MPAGDFDFLPGTWQIANRRLTNTLDPGCDEWEEFEATCEARAMLGGIGNVDHFRTDGYEGFSLRLYDPEADLWRIWWSSTARPGAARPARRGPLQRARPRPLRVRGRARGRADPDALRLVGDHRDVGPLGAGVLVRRRGDLEAELDYGPDACVIGRRCSRRSRERC